MGVYARELEVASQIARMSGPIAMKYFDGNQSVETKEDGSPVTIADKAINRMVIEELAKAFPDDVVIGEEESTGEYGTGRRWFCDPIDGTAGYVWGTPTSMFSLGLVVDGVPVVGVTYDPFLDRLYWAEKGEGAWMNGQRLQVSQTPLQDGILGISGSPKMVRTLPYIDTLLERNIKLAMFSGAVYKLMLIASGRFTGYVETLVNAHDMAASQVIVEEAGGVVTDIRGGTYDYTKPFKSTLASNGVSHEELVALLATTELHQ